MQHIKNQILVNSNKNIIENIFGLVLAGGKSTRMGIDKAMLNYRGIPQQYFLYKMMEKICHKVFISCNKTQKAEIYSNYNAITDNKIFINCGPIAGLLSYAKLHPEASVLLAACDYPYLKLVDLEYLVKNRKPEYDAVCYYNEDTGFDEPLIAVYETSALLKLFEYYNSGNNSLRHFLKTINTNRLKPLSPKAIESVDTFDKAIKIIKNDNKANDRK